MARGAQAVLRTGRRRAERERWRDRLARRLPAHGRRAARAVRRGARASPPARSTRGSARAATARSRIDRQCEDIVFAELERLHAEGHRVHGDLRGARRGRLRRLGSPVSGRSIDPLDGSLNARRTLPSHSLSIAVASGPTMADVELGYVYDFGADEEYFAARGDGAHARRRASCAPRARASASRSSGIESAKPERIAAAARGARGQGLPDPRRRLDRDLPLLRGRRAASTAC